MDKVGNLKTNEGIEIQEDQFDSDFRNLEEDPMTETELHQFRLCFWRPRSIILIVTFTLIMMCLAYLSPFPNSVLILAIYVFGGAVVIVLLNNMLLFFEEKRSAIDPKDMYFEESYPPENPIDIDFPKDSIICAICRTPIRKEENKTSCIHCGAPFHHPHIVKWLRTNDHCPHCRRSLKRSQLT